MQTWQNKCLRRTCSHFSSMCARLNPQNACKKSKEIQSLYSALASVASLHHTHFCLQFSQRSHARLSLSIAKRMAHSAFTLTNSVVTVFLSQNKVVHLDIVVVCHHIVARVRSVSDSPMSASLKRNRLARKFAYLQCPRLRAVLAAKLASDQIVRFREIGSYARIGIHVGRGGLPRGRNTTRIRGRPYLQRPGRPVLLWASGAEKAECLNAVHISSGAISFVYKRQVIDSIS